MGTWGTGIFNDDMAQDVKDEYHNLLHLFEDDTQIKRELLQNFHEQLQVEENVSVFWYTLAYCMWKVGRLDEETKAKALYYIENPEKDENLKLWQEFKKDHKERLKVLNKLKERLLSPQIERRQYKIKKSLPAKFEIGDIICYQLTEKEHKKFLKTIRPKNRFIDNYDEIVKAYELAGRTFDNNFICMIKLFDIECSIDVSIPLERAKKLGLTGHKEIVGVFQKITKTPLTIQEMYETSIVDESRALEEQLVNVFEQNHYLQEKLYRWDDPKFIDIKKFQVIGNNLELADFLIKKYRLNLNELKTKHCTNIIIRPLIEKENAFSDDW